MTIPTILSIPASIRGLGKNLVRTALALVAISLLTIAAMVGLTRQWAIIQATWMAFGSVPEMGLVEVRIDGVNAELIAHGEAERRFHQGQSVYDLLRDGSELDWWVIVRGHFRYQSMGFVAETDNRVFLFDAFTGQWVRVSGSIDTRSSN